MSKISNRFILTLVIALALTACGKKEETQAPSNQPAAEAPQPVAAAKPVNAADEHIAKGKKIFRSTCSMCHQTGAAGAPIIGNKAEWEPRIAQGMPTLYNHSIKGFTGKKGMMPAKGANPSLSDEDVKASVDYMVSKAK